jgi:hypothetical protein
MSEEGTIYRPGGSDLGSADAGSCAGSSGGADGGGVSLDGPGAASRADGSADGSARPPNPSASPGPLPAEFASSLPQPANASKAHAAIVTKLSLKSSPSSHLR